MHLYSWVDDCIYNSGKFSYWDVSLIINKWVKYIFALVTKVCHKESCERKMNHMEHLPAVCILYTIDKDLPHKHLH